jgi:hypothetical protein
VERSLPPTSLVNVTKSKVKMNIRKSIMHMSHIKDHDRKKVPRNCEVYTVSSQNYRSTFCRAELSSCPTASITRWKQTNKMNQVRTSPKSTGKNRGGVPRGFSIIPPGEVGLVGTIDRGVALPRGRRNVTTTSSDTRGWNSVCSGKRLGYSATAYCTCHELMSTRNAENKCT